jgi:ribosomal-protein-alanine N-acetyltransferase
MIETRVATDRLELTAGTVELAQAEMNDYGRFSRLLDARVPDDWPPELNDADTMIFFLGHLEEAPDQVGWWCWYNACP